MFFIFLSKKMFFIIYVEKGWWFKLWSALPFFTKKKQLWSALYIHLKNKINLWSVHSFSSTLPNQRLDSQPQEWIIIKQKTASVMDNLILLTPPFMPQLTVMCHSYLYYGGYATHHDAQGTQTTQTTLTSKRPLANLAG